MAEGGGDVDVKPSGSGEGGGGGDFKKLMTRKIGPFPVVVWIGAFLVVYYLMAKKNKSTGAGTATDPAGNVGQINPATGYVYGSAEDTGALGSISSGLGASTDSGTTGGSTVGGQYADNNAWAVAAINYLVSIGVDATSANSAITQFLGSQQLTTQQQGEVNLAIQRLGAPPSPPEPGGSTPPVVTPPNTSTAAANPPTGFVSTSVTPTAVGLKWNKTVNAKSYTIFWGTTPSVKDGRTTVSTAAGTATGLKPNTMYFFRVQANPTKNPVGDPFASLVRTTARSAPAPAKPVPAKKTVPGKPSTKTPGK